mgnify:CR=1 FL=1
MGKQVSHKLRIAGWVAIGAVAGALTTVQFQAVARGTMAPSPNSPEQAVLDRELAAEWFAARRVALKGHPLAWHTLAPDWLLPLALAGLLERRELAGGFELRVLGPARRSWRPQLLPHRVGIAMLAIDPVMGNTQR